MKERRCDVLVVGGGPAGAEAARAAAEAGVAVLVVDRRPQPGEPVQCGEWVPRLIRRHVPVPREAVAAAVAGMRTRWWVNGARGEAAWEEQHLDAPGFLLHRALFDRHLLARAEAAGAEVWSGASAVGLEGVAGEGAVVLVRRRGELTRVRAAVVVGADGARSAVGRWIGLANRALVLALQREVPCTPGAADGSVEVYLHPGFAGGYGWYFPKGRTANVGVGVNPALAGREALPRLLDWFLSALGAAGKVAGPPIRATGGWIPVGGMLPRVRRGRFLLAGDAAGLAHPITGAGVHHAVVSGRLAGAAAAEGLRRGESALAGYDAGLRAALGEHLAWGAARREECDRLWGRVDFPALVRRTWVSFPAFWAGRLPAEGGRMAHG